MKKAKLSWLFILNVCLVIVLVLTLSKPTTVKSALASHVVISEVQIGLTGASTNEFVELYNPSGSPVDISGWKITKKTELADPATDQVLLATIPASTNIASHGYYLIAHTDYTGSITENLTYSDQSLSSNNTIYLKTGVDALVDKLGLGSGNDFETAAKGNPPALGSVERKANTASTATTMQTGVDVLAGNGEDTDDNSLDFVNRAASDPQNAASALEPATGSPSPSASVSSSPSASSSPSTSPSASPSPSSSPSASASPSSSPSPSASASPSTSPSTSPSSSPSASPSATPSASPSPSASVAPSASPSTNPSMSPSASPSATVSASPSHTPAPSSTPKPRNKLVCSFKPLTVHLGRFTFTIHILDCDWIKV